MPTSFAIAEKRQTFAKASALITTFQNRQNKTLTEFETLCASQKPDDRRQIVSVLSSWTDDMAEGGISALYRKKAIDGLTEGLSRFSVWGHIFRTVPGTRDKAEAITMSYCLSSPGDRKRVKKNIELGHIYGRPMFDDAESPDFKKRSTADLGKSIYQLQVHMQDSSSVFNIPNHFSHHAPAEKKAIENTLRSVARQMGHTNIGIGVQQMTQDLVPFFLKETRPMAIRSEGLAFSTALYGRISWGGDNTQTVERIQSVLNVAKTFSFLFLSMPAWKQEGMIRHLYPKKQKEVIRNFFRMAAKSDCHCRM